MNKRQIQEATRLSCTVKFCEVVKDAKGLDFWTIDWVTSKAELDYEPPIFFYQGDDTKGIYVDFDNAPNKAKYRNFRNHPANDTPLAVLNPDFVFGELEEFSRVDGLLYAAFVTMADLQKESFALPTGAQK